MKNNSDKIGRSLEYVIVANILEKYDGKIKLSNASLKDQERDQSKYNSLSEEQKNHFYNGSCAIMEWLENKFEIHNSSKIIVDYLPDSAALNGDVTDVRIIIDNATVNISIEHNHTALKHQRPPSTPQQCGFTKCSTENIEYRKLHRTALHEFQELSKERFPGITLFLEVKHIDSNFIDENLYSPVCSNVTDFLNQCGKNNFHA